MLRDAEVGSFSDGPLHHDWPVKLPRPGELLRCTVGPGEAVAYDHRTLVASLESGGSARAVEGGGVRRQRCSRLSLSEALGRPFDEATGAARQERQVVELRLWPLLQDLPAGRRHTESRHDTVSDETQWAFHRSSQKQPLIGGGSKARPLEEPQVSGPLREECKACSQLPKPSKPLATPLPRRRKTSRGCDVGQGPSSSPSFVAKDLKGEYVADFFAGVGGVAKACRHLGFAAKEWELNRGSEFDLTSRSVLRKIKKDVNARLVIAAMLAPPCSSFSVARDRTAVIRNRLHPWGLPDDQLLPGDQIKVRVGNQCFQAALQIITWLDRHRIPWILENPAASKCWFLPPLQNFSNHRV